MLHLVQREGAWAGCGPAQSPPRSTKCNSPRINGQCTNFDVGLQLPLESNGLRCRATRAGVTCRQYVTVTLSANTQQQFVSISRQSTVR